MVSVTGVQPAYTPSGGFASQVPPGAQQTLPPQIASCASGACGALAGVVGSPWGPAAPAVPAWAAAMQTWMQRQSACCGSSCCGQMCQACCGGGGMAMPPSFAQNYPAQRNACNQLLGCAACACNAPASEPNPWPKAMEWLTSNGFDPDVKADPWGNNLPEIWKDICTLAKSLKVDPKTCWALMQQVTEMAGAAKA